MIYLYTYGTLKVGHRNHILLASCPFIQEATTQPKYRLYDCGPFPCLVKADEGRPIRGEIFEIDEIILRRLDHLEGVPFLYQREEIALQDFDKPTIAYFYQDDVSEFIDCGTSWPRNESRLRK